MLNRALSKRQLAVLDLMIERKSNREIAAALGMEAAQVMVLRALMISSLPSGVVTPELLRQLKQASERLAEPRSESTGQGLDEEY